MAAVAAATERLHTPRTAAKAHTPWPLDQHSNVSGYDAADADGVHESSGTELSTSITCAFATTIESLLTNDNVGEVRDERDFIYTAITVTR